MVNDYHIYSFILIDVNDLLITVSNSVIHYGGCGGENRYSHNSNYLLIRLWRISGITMS